MTDPRFLLAKYVPDMHRMEPRNVGLFLWNKGRILAQFLDSADVSSFVNDISTYRQWVDYWTDLIGSTEIKVSGRPAITTKDAACLQSLLATQDGNYLLVDAGFVPTTIPVKDTKKAVEYLFGKLVATNGTAEDSTARPQSFASRCESLFADVGVEVYHDKTIELSLFKGKRSFSCNYYIGNGHPDAIFQRARLEDNNSVNSAALMLHEAIEGGVVDEHHCGVFVRKSALTNEATQEGFDFLNRICPVIDIESDDATDRLIQLLPDSRRDSMQLSPELSRS